MSDNWIIRYFRESFQELGKVSWPTRNQAIRLAMIVLAFLLISALILSAIDFVFNLGFNQLILLKQ